MFPLIWKLPLLIVALMFLGGVIIHQVAKAQSPIFLIEGYEKSELKFTDPHPVKLGERYKNERASYLFKEATKKGFNDSQARYLVAQIHRENGAWAEETRGDGGCSVGLIQWNECARGKIPHTAWEKQLMIFLDEIWHKYTIAQDRFDVDTAFHVARVSWNKPVVMRTGSYKTVYYYDILKTYNLIF